MNRSVELPNRNSSFSNLRDDVQTSKIGVLKPDRAVCQYLEKIQNLYHTKGMGPVFTFYTE